MTTLQQAAIGLKRLLFGHLAVIDADGFIGLGDDVLHVYVQTTKRKWGTRPRPDEYEGFKLVWHWNVGPIMALSA